ncbi:hypothetical protein M8818_000335 [Zalaria obscura]|uniref:Uncharacterized protein n=1 Tax=Zalaria obscura TaxID=2024903 RepID=A0ACC3SPI8_9PEZI
MKLSQITFTGFALVATVSSTAIARAWDGKDGHAPRHGCLTDSDAAKLVAIFENFFVSFDEATARKYLAPGFQEISDSINQITPGKNFTSGDATVSGLENFITTQSTTGTGPAFETLNIWHSCNTITFRWRQATTPLPTQGIDVLVIDPHTHLIVTDYSEFNNVALLADFGCQFDCPSG